MIPEGWQYCTLADAVEFKSGGTPSKQISSFWDGEFPWVSAKDLKSHYIDRAELHLSMQGKAQAKIAKIGAVLILVRGMTLLKNIPIGFVRREVAFNQDIKALESKKNSDPLFISYLLVERKQHIRSLVNTANHGTGRLDTSLLQNLPIPLPPLTEQKKIAEILSAWDRAIETVEKLIANSQAQKKALMQQLLTGKKRLPGFNGAWKFQRIDQISTRITRRNSGNKYPVMTISSSSGFVRQDEKYSRFMAGKSVENYIVLSKGEFAYNKGNSKTYEFGCIFDLETYPKALVPHVYVCFKLNPGLSRRFYKALFESDYLCPQLRRLVNTGVRNNGLLNITPKEFLRTVVPVPSIAEQESIASIMENSADSIRSLGLNLDSLRAEKSALMQQLLTGKRRVKIEEAVS